MRVFQVDPTVPDENAAVINIGKYMIEDIRSLAVLLDNENLTAETKEEINKTIRTYLAEIRKICIAPF